MTENSAFSVDDKVRFTAERLDVLSPQDSRRLVGRTGVVQGFRSGIRKPIVYFAATRDQPDLRLFDVDPKHLERVTEEGHQPEAPHGSTDAIEDHSAMSQGEADHLFD